MDILTIRLNLRDRCVPSNSKILMLLIVLAMCLAVITGCSSPRQTAKIRVGSASKTLSDSLAGLKNTKSYRFTGAGTIQYMSVADRGTFTLSGEFLSPDRSHMTMGLKLGNAAYHSEIFYRQQTMYQILDNSWKKVNFGPDTLVQPGYLPINLLMDEIGSLAVNPIFGQDEEYNGKKVIVVKVTASPRKLKSYLQKQFLKTAGIEPDRRTGLMNFLKSGSVSRQYTIYIDPNTKQIVKVLFLQTVKISLSGKTSETSSTTTYHLSDFGEPVRFPAMPGKSK